MSNIGGSRKPGNRYPSAAIKAESVREEYIENGSPDAIYAHGSVMPYIPRERLTRHGIIQA